VDSPELIEIDVESGARRGVSGGFIGSGPGIYYPEGVAWDEVTRRALVADEDLLIAIDVVTGDRVIVSY
jgi:hypothetical protein